MLLRNGIDLIVTCSPIYLQCCHAERAKARCYEQEWEIAEKFEQDYPALNIFLMRDGIPYQTKGRYETLEESVALDDKFIRILKDRGIWQLRQFKLLDRSVVLDEVRKYI